MSVEHDVSAGGHGGDVGHRLVYSAAEDGVDDGDLGGPLAVAASHKPVGQGIGRFQRGEDSVELRQ